MKRILITGGAGFLGSHLCRELVSQGNYVTCLDNFLTGSKENVDDLLNFDNFSLVEHDIETFYDCNVDQIYNLACPASPPQYQKNAVKTVRTCTLGALNVLELAKNTGARVFQASTSEVYGDPHIHPQPESYWGNVNPFGDRSCYDEGKRCAEAMFYSYHQQQGVDIRIARIFNTYGPYMDLNDGRVVSNFIVQSLKNQPITIYGDGNTTRSFCYVSDNIQGLIALMNSSIKTPVNIGNPTELTLIGLAQKIIDITGSKSDIVYLEQPNDDPHRRKPDISSARNLLGWKPTTSLNDGLSATIKWFQTKID